MAPNRSALRLAGAAFGILAASFVGTASSREATSVKAWISLEPAAGGHQQFVGHASAAEPFVGRFELVGERRGAGGVSNVTQSGAVRLAPNQAVRLSQLSFGDVSSAVHYSVKLRIFAGNDIVGTAEIAK